MATLQLHQTWLAGKFPEQTMEVLMAFSMAIYSWENHGTKWGDCPLQLPCISGGVHSVLGFHLEAWPPKIFVLLFDSWVASCPRFRTVE